MGEKDCDLAAAAPDFEFIHLLHRAKDSHISFGHHSSSEWINLFSLRADELDKRAGSIVNQLVRDCYFSVNGFYRAAYGKNRMFPSFPCANRNRNQLRYLNACFIDLDAYKLQMSQAAMEAAVDQAQRGGLVPPVTYRLWSGRGLWLFWLLHAKDDSQMPQKAFSEKVVQYERIQDALRKRFWHLCSDAADVVRTVRIPGTINSKSGNLARYCIGTNDGVVRSYTLQEMASFLGIQLHPKRKQKRVRSENMNRKVNIGKQKLYEYRLEEFTTLERLRGGFHQGCRNVAAVLYVHILAQLKLPLRDIERKLEHFCERCHPHLKRSEKQGAFKSGLRAKKYSNRRISDLLEITPAEAKHLKRWKARGAPDHVVEIRRLTQHDQQEYRREVMTNLLKCFTEPPSSRKMAMMLQELGLDVSHATVCNDYRMLLRTSRIAA